jgi:hypothetical protein
VHAPIVEWRGTSGQGPRARAEPEPADPVPFRISFGRALTHRGVPMATGPELVSLPAEAMRT